jgi:hypothetical protein
MIYIAYQQSFWYNFLLNLKAFKLIFMIDILQLLAKEYNINVLNFELWFMYYYEFIEDNGLQSFFIIFLNF